MSDRPTADRWVYAYDDATRYVGASHPRGGRRSIAEIKLPHASERQAVGELLAATLNRDAADGIGSLERKPGA